MNKGASYFFQYVTMYNLNIIALTEKNCPRNDFVPNAGLQSIFQSLSPLQWFLRSSYMLGFMGFKNPNIANLQTNTSINVIMSLKKKNPINHPNCMISYEGI